MANRNASKNFNSLRRKVFVIDTWVNIHTDATVLTTSDAAWGAWTKSATGEYTFTMTDKFYGPLTATATLEATGTKDLAARINAVSLSGKTVKINTVLSSTGAIADNGSSAVKVHVIIVVGDSSVSTTGV